MRAVNPKANIVQVCVIEQFKHTIRAIARCLLFNELRKTGTGSPFLEFSNLLECHSWLIPKCLKGPHFHIWGDCIDERIRLRVGE